MLNIWGLIQRGEGSEGGRWSAPQGRSWRCLIPLEGKYGEKETERFVRWWKTFRKCYTQEWWRLMNLENTTSCRKWNQWLQKYLDCDTLWRNVGSGLLFMFQRLNTSNPDPNTKSTVSSSRVKWKVWQQKHTSVPWNNRCSVSLPLLLPCSAPFLHILPAEDEKGEKSI